MKIQIKLTSLLQSKNIVITEQECFYNGKQKNIACNNLIYKLVNTVVSWQPEMINNEIVDGLQYNVKIENNGQFYNFVGSNEYPENFDEFLDIIKEIENC